MMLHIGTSRVQALVNFDHGMRLLANPVLGLYRINRPATVSIANLDTFLTYFGMPLACSQGAMAIFDNPKPAADPEVFEKVSKRVVNKLRSDLDSFMAPEDIGIPLLRYALHREGPARKVIADSGKDYRI